MSAIEPESPRCRWFAMLGVAAFAIAMRIPTLFAPFFMDEGPILKNIQHFISARTLLPEHYSYPPLFSYCAVLPTGLTAVGGGALAGLPMRDWALLQSAFAPENLALGARLLTVAYSVAAALLPLVLLRSLPLAQRVLAGLLFASCAVAVEYGIYALPDVPTGLFATAAAMVAVLALERVDRRLLIAAGALAGVAAAFKFNGALACLPVGVAALLWAAPAKTRAGLVVLAAAASIAAFLILTPTWIFRPSQSLAGFLYESSNVRTARPLDPPGGVLRLLWRLLLANPLVPLALAVGVAGWLRTRDRALGLWLLLPLANFAIVATWAKQDANYLLPSLPILGVLFVRGAAALGGEARGTLAAKLLLAAQLVLIAAPLRHGLADNQREAARFLAHLPGPRTPNPGSRPLLRIGFYTPKVWDAAEEQRFLAGAGAGLSPAGRTAFAEALAAAPRAARVLATADPDDRAAIRELLAEGKAFVAIVSAPHEQALLAFPEERAEELSDGQALDRELVVALHHGAGHVRTVIDSGRGAALAVYLPIE